MAVAPVGGRALVVVALQRVGVVGALVAEQLAERLVPARTRDEPVPVVVADLVPQVAEQRAVGLVQRVRGLLARDVVRFLDVDRDDAVRVPGHHRRAAGRRAQEIEREPALGILVAFEVTGRSSASSCATSRRLARSIAAQ